MQDCHVPSTGSRYWVAISVASVFGANMGDFASHTLHLGHWRGLLPLAVILAGIMLAERRSRTPTEIYYWLAIVTLRTAATNLADLATHDFRLAFAAVDAGLLVLLPVVLTIWRPLDEVPTAVPGVPRTDGRYWTAMLVAGTLGTALGDTLADGCEINLLTSSMLSGAVLAALLVLRGSVVTAATYWVAIVAVRTAGTNVGDLFAHILGLAPSTALSGVALVLILAASRLGRPVVVARPAERRTVIRQQ